MNLTLKQLLTTIIDNLPTIKEEDKLSTIHHILTHSTLNASTEYFNLYSGSTMGIEKLQNTKVRLPKGTHYLVFKWVQNPTVISLHNANWHLNALSNLSNVESLIIEELTGSIPLYTSETRKLNTHVIVLTDKGIPLPFTLTENKRKEIYLSCSAPTTIIGYPTYYSVVWEHPVYQMKYTDENSDLITVEGKSKKEIEDKILKLYTNPNVVIWEVMQLDNQCRVEFAIKETTAYIHSPTEYSIERVHTTFIEWAGDCRTMSMNWVDDTQEESEELSSFSTQNLSTRIEDIDKGIEGSIEDTQKEKEGIQENKE